MTVSVRSLSRGSTWAGRGEPELVVDEVLVHVVRHHPDLRVADQDVGERLQLGLGVGRAGRVVGRVQDHPLGLRPDRLLEILGPQLEAGLLGAGHRHRRAAGQQHHVGVGHPVGRGDDHLVARVEGRHQGVVEHLLAARPDRDLVERVVEPVLAPELALDRLLQLRRAVDRGVLGLAPPDRLDRGRLDVLGRVEVRLPGAQADHVAPLCLELTGEVGDRDGRRRLDAPERGREDRQGRCSRRRGRGGSRPPGRGRQSPPAAAQAGCRAGRCAGRAGRCGPGARSAPAAAAPAGSAP